MDISPDHWLKKDRKINICIPLEDNFCKILQGKECPAKNIFFRSTVWFYSVHFFKKKQYVFY